MKGGMTTAVVSTASRSRPPKLRDSAAARLQRSRSWVTPTRVQIAMASTTAAKTRTRTSRKDHSSSAAAAVAINPSHWPNLKGEGRLVLF